MPSIHYDFSAAGYDQVRRAYQSVAEAEEKAAAAHERASKAQESVKTRDRATRAAQDKQEPSRAKQAAESWVKAQEKGAVTAAKNRLKSADQAAREEVKIEERKARSLDKINREMESRYQRHQQQKVAFAEREAEARRQATADKRSGSRGAMWEFAGNMVGYKAGMKLYDTVTSAAREAMALQESTNRLSINARQAGAEFVDPTTLRKEFEKAAIDTPGQKASEISSAIQSFVSLTGELETGRKSASTFATVASATGANVGDVSQAAASIFNQFQLKTKDEMQDVLASLTFQGKQGAFELSDAASQFQRLAAAGASFGLSGAKGVKTIGGLAQIARTGTGSAEQTTTALENIFTNLIAKSALLKQQGVNVYDKTGKTRDVTEVLIEAIAKSGKGNFEKKGQILQKVFLDQGIRGVRPLMAKYQTTFQGVRDKGGSEAEATAAGIKRLRDEIEKSVNAPGAWAEVQKDAAQAQKDASAQTTQAWERIKAATAEKLLPALEQATPKLMKLFFGEGGEDGPAMMAVSGFADGIGLASEAVGEFVDSLYATGILKRKQKTDGEVLVDAQKSLEKFDKDTGGAYKPGADFIGPIDPKMAEEREKLVAGVGAAEARFWSPKGEKDLTRDEFEKKFVEYQGTGFFDEKGADAAKLYANNILKAGGDYDSDRAGLNDRQQQLVAQYAQQTRDQTILRGGASAMPEADQVASDMAILAAAAKTAAAALALVKANTAANITGTSGPTI